MNAMYKNSINFRITYILIALNVAMYIYTSVIGGNFLETDSIMIYLYGQVNSFVINFGWYWQLITSMFVHANIAHLAGNMSFLFIFGLRAEEMFSMPEYLLIYFLSGLTGNFLTLLLTPIFGFDIVSVGASGAIFGIFGAVTIYLRRAVGASIITALMYAVFLLLISSGPSVNNLAHLGGLIIGLLIGYLLATRRRRVRRTISYSYSVSYQGKPTS
jgi:rhomboid protease GluP